MSDRILQFIQVFRQAISQGMIQVHAVCGHQPLVIPATFPQPLLLIFFPAGNARVQFQTIFNNTVTRAQIQTRRCTRRQNRNGLCTKYEIDLCSHTGSAFSCPKTIVAYRIVSRVRHHQTEGLNQILQQPPRHAYIQLCVEFAPSITLYPGRRASSKQACTSS